MRISPETDALADDEAAPEAGMRSPPRAVALADAAPEADPWWMRSAELAPTEVELTTAEALSTRTANDVPAEVAAVAAAPSL